MTPLAARRAAVAAHGARPKVRRLLSAAAAGALWQRLAADDEPELALQRTVQRGDARAGSAVRGRAPRAIAAGSIEASRLARRLLCCSSWPMAEPGIRTTDARRDVRPLVLSAACLNLSSCAEPGVRGEGRPLASSTAESRSATMAGCDLRRPSEEGAMNGRPQTEKTSCAADGPAAGVAAGAAARNMLLLPPRSL